MMSVFFKTQKQERCEKLSQHSAYLNFEKEKFSISEEFQVKQEHITGQQRLTKLTALSRSDKHFKCLQSKASLFFAEQSGNGGNPIPWESNVTYRQVSPVRDKTYSEQQSVRVYRHQRRGRSVLHS